jgi:hypothetical protein
MTWWPPNCHLTTTWQNYLAITISSSQSNSRKWFGGFQIIILKQFKKTTWWLLDHHFETPQKMTWRPLDHHLKVVRENDLMVAKLSSWSNSKKWFGCRQIVISKQLKKITWQLPNCHVIRSWRKHLNSCKIVIPK